MIKSARIQSDPADWQALGLTPGLVLRTFGMRRSGNHAISDWLIRNAPVRNSVFLNNCKPGPSPLTSFRSLAVNGKPMPVKTAVANLPDIVAPAGDGAMLLISYEDTSPAESWFLHKGPTDFDERLIDRDLIVYRGFLNWSASLLKKLQPNKAYSLALRCSVVLRAIDCYTRLLGLVETSEELQLTCINYDAWFRSKTYRSEVLKQLDFPVLDNTLGSVQHYGGGSSFQKDATEPMKLATDARWQQMVEDPEYQAILHLAARDLALTDRLQKLFPQDAATLADVTALAPFPTGLV